jgi:hypothetical protein
VYYPRTLTLPFQYFSKNRKNQKFAMSNLPYNYPRECESFANSDDLNDFNEYPESCNFVLRNEHFHHETPYGSSYQQGYHDECYNEEGFGFQEQGYDPYYSYEPQRSGHSNSWYGYPPENQPFEQYNLPHPPYELPQEQDALDENSRIENLENQLSLMWEAVRRLEAQYAMEVPSQVEPIPSAMHEEEFERDEEFVVEPSEVEMEVSVLESFPSPLPSSPPLIQQIPQPPEILKEPSTFKLPSIPSPLRPYTPHPSFPQPSFTFPTKVKDFKLLLYE